MFPVWMIPEQVRHSGDHLERGFAKAGNGKSLQDFEEGLLSWWRPTHPAAVFDSLRPGSHCTSAAWAKEEL
ncbi:MAG: hypothetical protein R3E50_16130 [Halioglobus sp.]